MKIHKMLTERNNDFSAIMECEHCGCQHKITTGYHDNFYHTKVIPAMTCPECRRNRSGAIPERANVGGKLSVT